MEFREKILETGDRSLKIMDEYLEGKRAGSDLIKEASKMVAFAIKVEHMNQIKNQADRSFALRLIPFLPKDKEVRERYIEMTNPGLKPLLLSRPK